MQSGTQTPSVIARLMGLDDLPTQSPTHKQRRVLSESYLRKTASIGQWENSRFYLNRSGRINNNHQRSKDGIEDETPLIERNLTHENTNSSAISTTMSSVKQQSRGGKHNLRSLQKLEKDPLSGPVGKIGTDNLHKPLISRIHLKQKRQVSPTRFFDFSHKSGANGIFLSGDSKNRDLARAGKGEDNNDTAEKERRTDEMERFRPNNRVLEKIEKRSDTQEILPRREATFECSLERSDLVRVAKKQIFERWRTTKKFEEGEVANRRCTLGEMCAHSNMEINPKSLINKFDNDNFFSQHNGKLNSDVLNSSTERQCSCVAEDVSADGKLSDYDNSSSEFKELPFEPMAILLVKDDDMVEVWETSNSQKSSNNFHVEGFGFSNSTKTVPVFLMDSREGNQTSPNSVLDPSFEEGAVSISEAFNRAAADFYSLPRRLRPQKSKSEETYAEGTGMAISSDEDTEEVSVAFSHDTGELFGPCEAEESRNFSYLVDVLDEAGFMGINLEMSFRKWHSLEYPMSPSVFEALEKKFGKQACWQRSERRLLFDQFNEGLKEILNMCIPINLWAKPLRKRFSSSMRRDEIEEELWTMLISEEKEAYKDLSEKALGRETKWLQLTEVIHEICKEIEHGLFDALVGELADVEGL